MEERFDPVSVTPKLMSSPHAHSASTALFYPHTTMIHSNTSLTLIMREGGKTVQLPCAEKTQFDFLTTRSYLHFPAKALLLGKQAKRKQEDE